MKCRNIKQASGPSNRKAVRSGLWLSGKANGHRQRPPHPSVPSVAFHRLLTAAPVGQHLSPLRRQRFNTTTASHHNCCCAHEKPSHRGGSKSRAVGGWWYDTLQGRKLGTDLRTLKVSTAVISPKPSQNGLVLHAVKPDMAWVA